MASFGTSLASTAELVEMILLQLPLPDILLAQRVDRFWKATIERSPTLQRALFFRPMTNIQLALQNDGAWLRSCQNNSECRRDASGHPRHRFPGPNFWAQDLESAVQHNEIMTNPFLTQLAPYLRPVGTVPNEVLSDLFEDSSEYDSGQDIEPPKPRRVMDGAAARPEASWRRMLLTQPPVRKLIIDQGRAQHWHKLGHTGGSGLTLDEFIRHGSAFDDYICQLRGAEALRGLGPLEPWERPEATAVEAFSLMERAMKAVTTRKPATKEDVEQYELEVSRLRHQDESEDESGSDTDSESEGERGQPEDGEVGAGINDSGNEE